MLITNNNVISEWCLPEASAITNNGTTPAAPMTIRVLGLHDFHQSGEVSVRCFLNGQDNMLVKTHYKKITASVDFNIDDENESTTTLFDALRSTLTFIVAQRRT